MSELSVQEPDAPQAAPARDRGEVAPKERGHRRSEGWLALLFLLPSALILGGFGFFPLLYAFYVSLHKWTLVQGPFVGFSNYRQAFTDPAFWDALRITVYYVLGTVPPTLA